MVVIVEQERQETKPNCGCQLPSVPRSVQHMSSVPSCSASAEERRLNNWEATDADGHIALVRCLTFSANFSATPWISGRWAHDAKTPG